MYRVTGMGRSPALTPLPYIPPTPGRRMSSAPSHFGQHPEFFTPSFCSAAGYFSSAPLMFPQDNIGMSVLESRIWYS